MAILGPSLVPSVGIEMCFMPLGTVATAGVDRREAGMASVPVNTSRQVGGSTGLATLASTVIGDHGDALRSALADGYGAAIGAAGALACRWGGGGPGLPLRRRWPCS